jgi:hypothetical protein
MARWLRSERAMRLFSYSSKIVIGLGVFFVFMMTSWFGEVTQLKGGELSLRILGGFLGVLGAPAALIIWFGMLWFCLTQDGSDWDTRILWCFAFLVTGPFASALYFYTAYRKQIQYPVAPQS